MNKIITDLVVIESTATTVDITVQPGPLVEIVQPPAIYVEIGDIGGPVGPQGPQGIPGPQGLQGLPGTGFIIKGSVPTYDALPVAPAPNPYDGWVTDDTDHLWVWNGYEWVDCGDLSGPPGPTGAQGNTGQTGLEGPLGPAGPAGPTGHEGPQGPPGEQGEVGYQGPIGPQGASGLGVNFKGTVPNASMLPAGAAANDGYVTLDTGYTWVWTGGAWINVGIIQGPVGPMGPQGNAGPQGNPGPQGIQGNQGLQGDQGAQGPAGVDGAAGPQGAPGSNGEQGPPGSQGPQGPTGVQGPVGPVGTTDYDDLTNVPSEFPPAEHAHAQTDIAGLVEDQAAQDAAIAALMSGKEPVIAAGTATQYWSGLKSWLTLDKAAVGLGNADDTSDANKPISTATQTALNTKENTANRGVANGYAPLDGSAKVPAGYLPAYVDDVIEAASFAALPATGAAGVIYVTLDTNKTYRWSGTAYVEISPSPGSTDAVPEGSINKYFTDARAIAAVPVKEVADGQNYVRTLGAWVLGYTKAAVDALVALYLPLTGGTLTGRLNTKASSATEAGLNLIPGVAPTAPVTGDFWATTGGFYGRAIGVTKGPFVDTGDLATKANAFHTHPQADVTNLVSDLAGKAPTVHGHAQADVTNLVSDLALKAPLANPALTGVPTAPTAALATNTTQLATTAFVQAAMALAGDLPLMVGAADGSTDLDTIQTAGWFDKLLGSANAHLPVSGNYFYVQTLVYAAGALTQVAYPYSTQATISLGIYVRGLYGGVWSPWNRLNLDATKLPLTGGTLTGNLTIDPANGMAGVSCSSADSHSYLVLDKGIVGAYSYIDGRYAGKVRWRMILGEATAEAGSNAGSNFVLQAYDDAGTAVVANALSIARSTGVVTMPGAIIPTRPAGDATGYAANTAFVTAVDVLKAPLASPAFTGVPTAPTPAVTSNDNTLATTAFATYTAPPGLIGFFARSTAPTGWIAANGALLNRTTYAILFAAIGTVFGAGDGTTTFGIPDLRGEFPRGWDNARGIDASRVFGSLQLDGIETHTHPFTGSAMATHDHGLTVGANSVGHTHSFADNSSATGNASANHQHTMTGRIPNTTVANGFGMGSGVLYSDNPLTSASGAAHTHTVAVAGTSGGISANHVHTIDITAVSAGTPAGTVGANTGAVTETRPRNVALLACIKYC